jgi:N-acetylmuramoyl-L-alanine amidase
MTNPVEFEWIQDPDAQQELAETLAAGIREWLLQTVTAPGEEKPGSR